MGEPSPELSRALASLDEWQSPLADLDWPPDIAALPDSELATAAVARAQRISAAVRELAAQRKRAVSVVVVDRAGVLVESNSMEGAAWGSPQVAQQVAAASALYGVRSADAVTLVRDTGAYMPEPVAAVSGGMPLNVDGKTYAGVGVAGGDPDMCERMLVAVMLSVA
jgi:uncharacterized protein GlcG (DUF336 family)